MHKSFDCLNSSSVLRNNNKWTNAWNDQYLYVDFCIEMKEEKCMWHFWLFTVNFCSRCIDVTLVFIKTFDQLRNTKFECYIYKFDWTVRELQLRFQFIFNDFYLYLRVRHNCLLKHQMTFTLLFFHNRVLNLKLNLLTWRWHQNYMFCINKLHGNVNGHVNCLITAHESMYSERKFSFLFFDCLFHSVQFTSDFR